MYSLNIFIHEAVAIGLFDGLNIEASTICLYVLGRGINSDGRDPMVVILHSPEELKTVKEEKALQVHTIAPFLYTL